MARSCVECGKPLTLRDEFEWEGGPGILLIMVIVGLVLVLPLTIVALPAAFAAT